MGCQIFSKFSANIQGLFGEYLTSEFFDGNFGNKMHFSSVLHPKIVFSVIIRWIHVHLVGLEKWPPPQHFLFIKQYYTIYQSFKTSYFHMKPNTAILAFGHTLFLRIVSDIGKMGLSCLHYYYLFAICGGKRVIRRPTKLWINKALLVHVTEARRKWAK